MTFNQFKLDLYRKLSLELEPNNSFHLNNLVGVAYDEWGITLKFKISALKDYFFVSFSDRKIEEWWYLVDQSQNVNKDKIWWKYIDNNIKNIVKAEFLRLLTKDWENWREY